MAQLGKRGGPFPGTAPERRKLEAAAGFALFGSRIGRPLVFGGEELHRVDRLVVKPHFKVQVWGRNPPSPAEVADVLALFDFLPFPDAELVQVRIAQDNAFPGVDVDGQAIGALAPAVHDGAGRGSDDFFPAFSGDVHARMHEAPAFDGMFAGAEGRGDPDGFLDGPDERKGRVERGFLEHFRRGFDVAVVEFLIRDGSEAGIGTVWADAGGLEFTAGRVGKRLTRRGAVFMQIGQ